VQVSDNLLVATNRQRPLMLNKPRLPRDPLQTWIEVVLDPVDQRIIELISEYPFLCAVNDQLFKFEIKPSLVESSGALERH
jgi:hypothetical protein